MGIKFIRNGFFLTIGAGLFAFGLEGFLVPHEIIDGGITGISIMFSHLFHINLGLLLVILNAPFLLIGWKRIGKVFFFSASYAILIGSLFTNIFHHLKPMTNDPLLATVFGGILLGIGVGLVIRNGGSLDGTEITAILLNHKIPFSVGEVVMFFNIFILGSAGFVFGWNQAMYSLIAYFIAFKTIDLTIEGLDQTRSAIIVSEHPVEIGEELVKRLGRGVTYLKGRGGYSKDEKKIIYCIITRLEESILKSVVDEIDSDALVAISHVYDVKGGQFKKHTE